MNNTTRKKAREDAEQVARERAVKEGADEQTLKVIDVMDVPLAYLPGNAVRFYLKVVGDLADCKAKSPEELSEIGITYSECFKIVWKYECCVLVTIDKNRNISEVDI